MKTIKLFAIVVLCVSFASGIHAQTLTIDFESDAAIPVPNGFASVDAPGVTFTDSIGANLSIGNFGVQSDGQGLLTGGDDPSVLIISIPTSADSISLDFGNDDACCSADGDVAYLAVFDGASLVAETSVVMNRDDIMNQTITYSGQPFNRAEFSYADPSFNPINLIEVVDNIVINPLGATLGPAVPVPVDSRWALLIMMLLLAGVAVSRLHRV